MNYGTVIFPSREVPVSPGRFQGQIQPSNIHQIPKIVKSNQKRPKRPTRLPKRPKRAKCLCFRAIPPSGSDPPPFTAPQATSAAARAAGCRYRELQLVPAAGVFVGASKMTRSSLAAGLAFKSSIRKNSYCRCSPKPC